MKLSAADWKKLRPTLVVFAITLLVMALLVIFAHDRKASSAQALATQKNQLIQARQKLRASGAEKANIIQYLPQYQKMLSHGLIGEERRIEWVETLRNIHKNNKLFSIKFSISAQEAFAPTFALNAEPFKLYHSIMKIEIALLHEADLMTLLDGLATEQTSLFIVRQCEIKRQTPSIGANLVPNMQGKCELDWLTLHEPLSKAVVPEGNQQKKGAP